MADSIIYIENISSDINYIGNSILKYQNNLESSTNKVKQTCISVINSRSFIDEDYFNIFTKETLPKMKEYISYKAQLISKIINLFQTIFFDFHNILQEIMNRYCENKKKEELINIRKNLDNLIEDIYFYKTL